MSKRGLGLVVYGGEGVGKTSWAAQFANIGTVKIVSVKETGVDDLQMVGDIPSSVKSVTVHNFEDLDEQTKVVLEDTLVIDSLMGVQTYIFDYVCRTQYNGKWDGREGFTSYWKGQRVDSPPVFDRWLDRLSALLANGKNVILIGHVFTVTLPNTFGADYLSHVVALDDGDKGGLRSCLMRWAPNVLFMNIDVNITRATEVTNQIVMEGKAHDTDTRLLYTQKSPGHAAKNRLKLPPVISLGHSAKEGFDAFIKALPKVVVDTL